MECLRNYIGLRGCGLQEPESNFYVNSLPGISLESIDKLADSEQRSYAGVWADIVNRSLTKMETAVTSAFSQKYKLKSIQQNIVTNRKDNVDLVNTIGSAPVYKGVKMELSDCQSPLLSFHIHKLMIYVPQAVSDLKVVVLNEDGNELWSRTQSFANAGWKTIQVNRTFIERIIYIGFDSSKFDVVTLQQDNSKCQIPCACDEHCKAIIEGWNGNDTTDNHFGVIAVATLQCSFAPLICAYRQLFTEAYWYLLGSEIATERLYSPRFNWITVNKDEAAELKAFYDAEFEHAKNRAVKGIDLDLHDCCIVCNEPFRVVENRL